MPIRHTRCEWDPRFQRCEHIADDGIVDLVTYQATGVDGDAAQLVAEFRRSDSNGSRLRWGWLAVSGSFLLGLVIGQVSANIAIR